ncbi:MAG: hypothetical protein ABGY95_06245 [Rubritalea sp.]
MVIGKSSIRAALHTPHSGISFDSFVIPAHASALRAASELKRQVLSSSSPKQISFVSPNSKPSLQHAGNSPFQKAGVGRRLLGKQSSTSPGSIPIFSR